MLTDIEEISLVIWYIREGNLNKAVSQLFYAHNRLAISNDNYEEFHLAAINIFNTKHKLTTSVEYNLLSFQEVGYKAWMKKHGYEFMYRNCKMISSLNLKAKYGNKSAFNNSSFTQKEIFKQRIKTYNHNTILTFGDFNGEPLEKLMEDKPFLVIEYLDKLTHFLPSIRVILSIEFLSSEILYKMIGKYIVKLLVLKQQNAALKNIEESFIETYQGENDTLINRNYERDYYAAYEYFPKDDLY